MTSRKRKKLQQWIAGKPVEARLSFFYKLFRRRSLVKNLANCKPSEFLAQTNKIRKSVAKWLTATDIANIRKRMPDLPEDVDEKDRKEAYAKQAKDNLSAILDAILDEHPEETLELMALLCFVEPEDVDSHPVGEYIMAINELLQDETTVSFFTSLTSLARLSTKMG